MQEQKAGGLTLDDVIAQLSPDADFWAVVQHCIVLKRSIEGGLMSPENIDFEEAAKAISFPVS